MRSATTLFLLALALFIVFLAGSPPGSSRGVVQPPPAYGPIDHQYASSTAKLVSVSREAEQAAAAARDREEPLAGLDHMERGTSRANTRAATVNAGQVRDEFWLLADRNRDAMYAILQGILDSGDDEDADLRAFILQTVDGRFDETPGEVFSVLLRTAPTPPLRKEVLRLLAQASEEVSLGQALYDPEPAIRQSAAASLGVLGVDALLDAMTDVVLDHDHSVRVTAFQTLEDMHGYAAIWDVAERVLDDPDPRIRKRALELISYGGVENALDHLTRSLLDPDPQVSELALALLAEFDKGPT